MSNKTIHELDNLSEIAQNDEMLIYDISAGADNPTKKTTVGNLLKDKYSTDEVKTNKVWIDGKPIYRKVFYSETNWGNTSTDLTIGNISFEMVVSIINISKYTSGGYYQNFGESSGVYSMAYVKDNGDVVRQRDGGFLNTSPSIIIIEYTKPTN